MNCLNMRGNKYPKIWNYWVQATRTVTKPYYSRPYCIERY